jgi:hypothetical protein
MEDVGSDAVREGGWAFFADHLRTKVNVNIKHKYWWNKGMKGRAGPRWDAIAKHTQPSN